MNEQKEIVQGSEQHEASRAEQAASPEVILRPAVDVYETGEGVILKADLPGVDKDGLNVQIDKDTLTIEGSVSLEIPKELEARYAEVQSNRYRHSFSLSRDLDTAKVQAELHDGILTLQIPKREEVKPRKITVSAA